MSGGTVPHPRWRRLHLPLTKQALRQLNSLVRSHPWLQARDLQLRRLGQDSRKCHLRLWPTFCSNRADGGNHEGKIMDGKLALLYLIIVALITFSYIDDENLGVMKQAITAFAVAQVH